MLENMNQAAKLIDNSAKTGQSYVKRTMDAQKDFGNRIHQAISEEQVPPVYFPHDFWQAWLSYHTDFIQRSVLFWDTLRERGNNWIDHEKEGKPPVLVFDYEVISDGRKFKKPVNYALLKIIPPEGTVIEDSKRPFVIVDPRAGHGPGIGGFKEDSEVGVAFRRGNPVYFISFYPWPVPDQTLPDIIEAEVQFLRIVIDRHPDSPKPVIIGNCQGGWAVMMLAASVPEMTGALVINGAPMSYWGDGYGRSTMRFAGGLLGGSWLSLLASNLGNDIFDGAHIVDNFERLNPANSYWDKYYSVFANIDKERQRFLDFEKWWGGFYHMNEKEISWIADNLFVGNKLARGEVRTADGNYFDLKRIRCPIIIFASEGDNITPPGQAFNWVADIYSSTEEVKANGQVIVGLMHKSIGHLGLFVSGEVARKEHSEIAKLLEYIDTLRPGLYSMHIRDKDSTTGKPQYEIKLKEHRLEDLKLRYIDGRADEKPFKAVKAISELNRKAYALYGRPIVRAFAGKKTARMRRILHPLRVQRWALSYLNPLLWTISPAASIIRKTRLPATDDNPFRKTEMIYAKTISATLNLYRDLRDALQEMLFYHAYTPMMILGMVEDQKDYAYETTMDSMDIAFVREALGAAEKGGYTEAIVRIRALIGRGAKEIPLSLIEMTREIVKRDKVLSKLSDEQLRQIRSRQAIVADLEPERAINTLPKLLTQPSDRKKALKILNTLSYNVDLTEKQIQTLTKIREVLMN
jgi:pimeloyl-ACP methyl ester carboxylesterase